MDLLQLASITLEAAAVFLGLKIAREKKKQYGYFIALTFGIYVIYDLANLFNYPVSEMTLRTLFFIASASILFAFYQIYKSKK